MKPTAKRAKRREHDPRKFIVVMSPDGVASVPGFRLESKANARDHWRSAAGKTARLVDLGQRMGRLMRVLRPSPEGLTVTFTRVGPRLLDSDNIASAFKAVRDGVATAYGVDDGPRGPITWVYEQIQGQYRIEARTLT